VKRSESKIITDQKDNRDAFDIALMENDLLEPDDVLPKKEIKET
jgi:hypothetical protein